MVYHAPALDSMLTPAQAAAWLQMSERALLGNPAIPAVRINDRVIRYNPRTIIAKFAGLTLSKDAMPALFGSALRSAGALALALIVSGATSYGRGEGPRLCQHPAHPLDFQIVHTDTECGQVGKARGLRSLGKRVYPASSKPILQSPPGAEVTPSFPAPFTESAYSKTDIAGCSQPIREAGRAAEARGSGYDWTRPFSIA